jgi:GNAT superfamily N-acetyltransferase
MIITSKLFEKLLQIFREKRVVIFFRPIIQRTPRYIFERNNHIWFSRNLDEEEIEVEPKIPVSINFSRSEFNETLDWIKANNLLWGHYEKELKVAINGGHYWVNAKSEEKIVGFMKIGFGKVFISDYDKIFQFPQNTVFLYEMRVVPEFGGKKIASYLLNESCKFFKRQGYTKALGYSHKMNAASHKSLSNAGFRGKKTIYYYKILGFKFLTSNPTDL